MKLRLKDLTEKELDVLVGLVADGQTEEAIAPKVACLSPEGRVNIQQWLFDRELVVPGCLMPDEES